jgi:hypothetical protein
MSTIDGLALFDDSIFWTGQFGKASSCNMLMVVHVCVVSFPPLLRCTQRLNCVVSYATVSEVLGHAHFAKLRHTSICLKPALCCALLRRGPAGDALQWWSRSRPDKLLPPQRIFPRPQQRLSSPRCCCLRQPARRLQAPVLRNTCRQQARREHGRGRRREEGCRTCGWGCCRQQWRPVRQRSHLSQGGCR